MTACRRLCRTASRALVRERVESMLAQGTKKEEQLTEWCVESSTQRTDSRSKTITAAGQDMQNKVEIPVYWRRQQNATNIFQVNNYIMGNTLGVQADNFQLNSVLLSGDWPIQGRISEHFVIATAQLVRKRKIST